MLSLRRTSQGEILVMTHCPAPTDLLRYALQRPDDPKPNELAPHVQRCAACLATTRSIRDAASVLLSAGDGVNQSETCLDEMTVASLAEGSMALAAHPRIVAHLVTCAACRDQLASISELLRDSAVTAEIRRIEMTDTLPFTRRQRVAGAGALMALAAAATFMVVGADNRIAVSPPFSSAAADAHREQSVTTAIAPRLITPAGRAAPVDTFRWTSVVHADRYRLTLYDRSGTVLWEAQGSDTTLVLPASITVERDSAYLWKVEARTEWDRWVASDLLEFSVARSRRIP